MKGIISLVLALALTPVAHAAPFLSTNPYPDTTPQPTEFLVSLDDGAEVESAAVAGVVSGDVILLFDLDGIQFGTHTASVKAQNATSTSEAATLTFDVGIETPNVIVIPVAP